MGKSVGKIIAIGVAIFAPYAAAALGLSGIGATLFSLGLQYATQSIFGSGAAGKRKLQDNGMLVNKASNTANLPVIYGSRRVGGTRVYLQTTDNNGVTSGTQYLHIVLAYAHGGALADGSHNMDGPSATKIILNDRDAWTSSGGIDSYFSGVLDVALFRGPTDQTHSVGREYNTFDDFDARKSDEWTSDYRMRGVAYLYARLKFSRDKFPTSPTIFIEANGQRIKDVDLMIANADGSATEDALRTHSKHDNPANILLDYLMNSTYGKGLAKDELDLATFSSAKSYFDTIGLTFKGAIDTEDTIFNNVQKILGSSNANLYYNKGKYAISVNRVRTTSEKNAAFEFNTGNIIGGWTISLGSKKSRYNQMKVNYFNPENNWQPNSKIMKGLGSDDYLTADGNFVNEGTVDLDMIGNETMAQKVAQYYLDQSRFTTTVQFKAAHTALELKVDDLVKVNHEVPGWTGANIKYMIVQSVVFNQDSTVDVTLQEYPNSKETIFIENR
tara:strand:+ start:6726 stop:8225 length:1500 start_codon:yes stop_codon:yes gene_type:complete